MTNIDAIRPRPRLRTGLKFCNRLKAVMAKRLPVEHHRTSEFEGLREYRFQRKKFIQRDPAAYANILANHFIVSEFHLDSTERTRVAGWARIQERPGVNFGKLWTLRNGCGNQSDLIRRQEKLPLGELIIGRHHSSPEIAGPVCAWDALFPTPLLRWPTLPFDRRNETNSD